MLLGLSRSRHSSDYHPTACAYGVLKLLVADFCFLEVTTVSHSPESDPAECISWSEKFDIMNLNVGIITLLLKSLLVLGQKCFCKLLNLVVAESQSESCDSQLSR